MNHETEPFRSHHRLLLPAALALLLAAAAVWFFLTHTVVSGHSYRRDSSFLDLRHETVTEADFRTLSGRLPDCHIRWSVPLSGGGQDSDSDILYLSVLSEDDIPLFSLFPSLRTVRTWDCTDYDTLLALQEAYPDVQVIWRVPIGEESFFHDVHAITLPLDVLPADELCNTLRYLPALTDLTLTGDAVPRGEQDMLKAAFPALSLHCTAELLGQSFSTDSESIDFTARPLSGADIRELTENIHRFPRLSVLDLTECGLPDEELMALREKLGVDIAWNITVYGRTFSTLTEDMDLSNARVRDGGAELEALLDRFPRLRRVDMSRCGLSNQEMDALNQKYKDIRFVWTVFFGNYSLRTDATYFIAAAQRNHMVIHDGDTWPLRYCTDLEALDLGHMELTDLSFLRCMPKMRYLILVENWISDISVLSELRDLQYLEIFWTYVADLSPLLECKKLQDLNICYIYAKADDAFEVLRQMPWLERLWYCGNYLSAEQIAELQRVMPGCEMYLAPHGESTGGTWREHPHYFEMRDFFHMYYMKGGTNGVDANGQQKY